MLSPATVAEEATLARAEKYAEQLLAASAELEKDRDLREGKLSSWPADALRDREKLLRERLVASLAATRRDVISSSPGVMGDELMLGPLLAATQKYKNQMCNKWTASPPKLKKCACEFREACLFSHGPTNKRRDPLTFKYGLKMCNRSADSGAGCPHGEDCSMCHTGVELRTHPIVLMRLLHKGDQSFAKLHGISLRPGGTLELRAASCRERHNLLLSRLLPPLKSVPLCAPCSPPASSPYSMASSASPLETPSPIKTAAADTELAPHVEALAMQLCSLVRQLAGKIQQGHLARHPTSSTIPPYAVAVTTLMPAYVRRFGGILPDVVRGLGFAKISELLNLPRLTKCLKLQLDGSKNQLVIWPVGPSPGAPCAHCASRKDRFPPKPSKEIERLLRLAEENGRRDRHHVPSMRPGMIFLDGMRQRAGMSSEELSTEDHEQSVRTPASLPEATTSPHKATAASPSSAFELAPMSLIKRFDDVVADEEASPPPEPAPSFDISSPVQAWPTVPPTYTAVAAGGTPAVGRSPFAIGHATPFEPTFASFSLAGLHDCSGTPPAAPTWVPGVPFSFFALPPLIPAVGVKAAAPPPIEEAALQGQLSELLSDGADQWFLDESTC